MQSSNPYLQLNVTDNKLDSEEAGIYTRITNSKYFILCNEVLYDCDGSLFESPTVTIDTELNTVTIVYDKFTILLNDTSYLIQDDVLDNAKLSILYKIYASIVSTGNDVNVSDYSFDATTDILTVKATLDAYTMSYDLPKLISDRISTFVANGSADKPAAMQDIIDAEVKTIYNLKSNLDKQAQSIYAVYIDVAQYKSQ